MEPAPKTAGASEARHARRFALMGAVMLGVVAVLWLAAATLVAYRLKYPPFLEAGGTDVYGPHAPAGGEAAAADPRTAFGSDFEPVQIPVARGESVEAWMIPGKLPAAILLVPPAGGTRRTMLPYAKFLHEAGYAVLAIDSGDDARSGTSWGWSERMGVLSAASELKRRGFEKIGALGVSEGAAEIILVQASGASFQAIIADSAYGSLAAMFQRVPSIAGLNPALQQTALWEAGFFLGHSVWKVDPVKAARDLGSASMLIIHEQGDQIVPVSEAQAIAAAAGNRADLWIVPGEGHGNAIYEAPEEYSKHTLKFLAENLLAPSSEGPRSKADSGRYDSRARGSKLFAGILSSGEDFRFHSYIRGGIKSTSSVDFNRSNSLSMSQGPSL